jgi:hypothetical protein
MKRLIPILALFSLIMTGCKESDNSGETRFFYKDGPQQKFQASAKIVLRYTPPPDPIFRISKATIYLDFDEIKSQIGGIPERPFVAEFQVELGVSNIITKQGTNIPKYDAFCKKAINSWIYTPFGVGTMRISVDMAGKRIIIDPTDVRKKSEFGREGKMGNPRELVRQMGFEVVQAKID